MTARISICIMLALAALSCGRHDNTPVPRRTAYPRPQLLDTVMTRVTLTPACSPAVNAAAAISSPRPGWLDVAYPGYGATMHLTVTDATPATVDEIKANRMERAMLNAGGLPGRQTEWTNRQGLDVTMIRTEGASTPLQFLATDDSSLVVSGAVYFSDPAAVTATDSIKPVLDAIAADIRRMLDSLPDD